MNKSFILLVVTLLFSLNLFSAAKEIKMTSSTTEMYEGDIFELNITFENINLDNAEIKYPNFNQYLSKIQGPFTSESTSIINGKISKSFTQTYRYTPKQSGNMTIPPVVVYLKGKRYRSNSINLVVYKENSGVAKSKKSKTRNIFLLATVDNSKPYIGEQIRLDYTLYISQTTKIKMPTVVENPSMKNFIKKIINFEGNEGQMLVQKIYKGKKYNTLPIKSFLLTPTSSGSQKISPFTISVPVQKKKKKRRGFASDPFFDDDIFSGYANYKDFISKSNSLKLDIRDLPASAPESFSGAIGKFSIATSLSSDSVATNESVVLKTVLKGNGNLEYIEDVKFSIPSDVEVYDSEKKITFQNSEKSRGRITLENILIPRIAGEQKIGGYEFSYFDPKKGKYFTLTGEDYTLKVSNGSSYSSSISNIPSNFSKKEIEFVGKDIRYIKRNLTRLFSTKNREYSFWNFYFYLALAIFLPFATFIIKLFVKKSISNIDKIRSNKALSVALKEIAMAKKESKKDIVKGYKRIEKGIALYLDYKLKITQSEAIFSIFSRKQPC